MRKHKLYLMTPSELKILEAVGEVETLGADERLTKAINLLHEAKMIVSEVIDEQIKTT